MIPLPEQSKPTVMAAGLAPDEEIAYIPLSADKLVKTADLPELAQHWVRYKAWVGPDPLDGALTFDNFMVWLMEDLSNEKA